MSRRNLDPGSAQDPAPDLGAVHPAREKNLTDAVAGAAADAGAPAELLGPLPGLLVAGQRPSPTQLTGFRECGAAAVAANVPLPAVVDLFLTFGWRLWPFLAASETNPTTEQTPQTARIAAVGAQVLRTLDDAVAALAEGYQNARRDAAEREQSLRREFIDDLLNGSADLTDLTERASDQGFRLAATHQLMVVRADRQLEDHGPAVRVVSSELAGAMPGEALLVTTKSAMLVVIAPSGVMDLVERVLIRLERLEPGTRWRAAVSSAAWGADGLRAGWLEATQMHQMAERLDLRRRVLHPRDVLAFRALLADPGIALALVEATLGPLKFSRTGAGPLVATLRAYFDAGANTTAAARTLHLSVRATVYRLGRIQDLTGLQLEEPTQRFTLQTAAVAAHLLGWPEPGPQDAPY